MTNAQTEARAIAERLMLPDEDVFNLAVDIIATALATKDAELDGAVFLKDAAEAALRKREVEINKLHAKLAEANKALDALGTPPSPIQRLGAAVSRRDWHEAEQAHEIIRDIIDAARRALTGEKDDG